MPFGKCCDRTSPAPRLWRSRHGNSAPILIGIAVVRLDLVTNVSVLVGFLSQQSGGDEVGKARTPNFHRLRMSVHRVISVQCRRAASQARKAPCRYAREEPRTTFPFWIFRRLNPLSAPIESVIRPPLRPRQGLATDTVGIISSVKWLSVNTVTSEDLPAFCNPMQATSSCLEKNRERSQSKNARNISPSAACRIGGQDRAGSIEMTTVVERGGVVGLSGSLDMEFGRPADAGCCCGIGLCRFGVCVRTSSCGVD